MVCLMLYSRSTWIVVSSCSPKVNKLTLLDLYTPEYYIPKHEDLNYKIARYQVLITTGTAEYQILILTDTSCLLPATAACCCSDDVLPLAAAPMASGTN